MVDHRTVPRRHCSRVVRLCVLCFDVSICFPNAICRVQFFNAKKLPGPATGDGTNQTGVAGDDIRNAVET